MININELMHLDKEAENFFNQNNIFCTSYTNYDCYNTLKQKILKGQHANGIKSPSVIYDAIRAYYIFAALDAVVEKIIDKAKQVCPNLAVTIKRVRFTTPADDLPTTSTDLAFVYEIAISSKKNTLSDLTIGWSPFKVSNCNGPAFDDTVFMKQIDNDQCWFVAGYYFNKRYSGIMVQESRLTLREVWDTVSGILVDLATI